MERGELELAYDDDRIVISGPYLWPCVPGPYIRFRRAPGCDAWEHRYSEIRGHTPDDATLEWLAPIVSVLSHPTGQDPDYADLARNAGMSLSSLRRRFRAATGVPVHEYHLRARIATARTLLAEARLPIKRIASNLGYRDVFFFTRQFTERTGVSPAAYRASALQPER